MMTTTDSVDRASLAADLVPTFVPFALGLGLIVFGSLMAGAVPLARAQMTLWLAILLAAPALWRWIVRAGRAPLGRRWRLWWTFAFLAYAGHIALGAFVLFRGDWTAIVDAQGKFVVAFNLTLTVAWAIEIVRIWSARQRSWEVALQAVTHLGFAAGILVAGVVLRDGPVRWIGLVMACAMLHAAARRWLTQPAAADRRP